MCFASEALRQALILLLQNTVVYKPENEGETVKKNLCPNHTHFLLVDDGSVNRFGSEQKIRTSLDFFLSLNGKYLHEIAFLPPDAKFFRSSDELNLHSNQLLEVVHIILVRTFHHCYTVYSLVCCTYFYISSLLR